MGYSIHIERQDEQGERLPISLEEWAAAVAVTDGVRLMDGDFTATNPRTGETISIRNEGGGAELFEGGEWIAVFSWRRGRASFKAAPDFEDSASPIRTVAAELAAKLGASLVGDEGEIYR